ncbi:NERD domain-containing protein [Pseudomonas viridiflava]|uniref:NERD domain-containing protein n=1 Tax=Pseudomonas viridiflava TaxID=33069 RepID=UPI000F016452|nr:NERD domain-containing protein [Pseudomonas viridiflava]
MNSSLHNRMLSDVESLKKLTAQLSLSDLTVFVTTQQRAFNEGRHRGHLGSPLKQGMYLLALASSQPEPLVVKPLNDTSSEQLVRRLESIFTKYGLAYFPTKQEHIAGLNDDWYRQREVAMPAFMHHFMAGFKASTEQIKAWIFACFNGFEKEIIQVLGMSHHDLLKVGSYIESVIEENAKPLIDALQQAKTFHQQFVQELYDGADFKEAIARARDNPLLKQHFQTVLEGSSFVFEVQCKQLIDKFGGDIADSVLKNFVTFRGKAKSITYITEPNPIIDCPLLTTDGERIFYIGNNSFYQAIIEKIEQVLAKSPAASRYLKERDRRLEQMTRNHLQKLFPDSTCFYESAFDRPDSHGEHDLVIVHQEDVYIIEAKASPPKEPLRDPSKAALRIKDHFRGRNGIQKAYDQANTLRKRLLENETTALYDKKGKLLVSLRRAEVKNIYCICVTRDDFGPIATNLSLLLEKTHDAPYPWVVCVTDLEYLIDALLYIGQGVASLAQYLDQRVQLHGKVVGSDELEYFGAFLRYGGLQSYIEAKADFIPLDITESDILDEIHACMLNGEPYELNVEPVSLVPLDRRKLLGMSQKSKAQSRAAKKLKKARQKQSHNSRKQNRIK